MDRFDEFTYGERIAEVYDRFYSEVDESAITLRDELAAGGKVLELGIGTGRIALPLHERGVEVFGIDASAAMIAKLREKPGGSEIQVHEGNFVDLPVEGKFSLIFVAFNTLFGLLTQDEQVRCIQSVAAHLTDEGRFLVEAFVPDLSRYEGGQSVRAVHLSADEVRLNVSQVDPVAQQVSSQQVVLTGAGLRLYPVKLRYIWPSELDLMARLAGLALRHRWGGWQKEEFTEASNKHVSVYGRSA
ncbi:MAG: class I SAM-dependent methyltransferase [Ardenticatenaceae bacterium]|nr:class I SAM-dependent methyltransferase [Ardenticatenaceae bacterium]